MSVILRYVDKKGLVLEHFLGVVHVPNTAAATLKSAIDVLFSQHNLSFSRVCGQRYDGASNMKGEFNGLKALILMENESAHYIHCFAHQLQLTLVAVAKNHIEFASMFYLLGRIVNVVAASCRRRDQLRESQASIIAEKLQLGEIESGRGLNQETNLKRAGDTHWGSHHSTIINMILMFSSVIDVLGFIEEETDNLILNTKFRLREELVPETSLGAIPKLKLDSQMISPHPSFNSDYTDKSFLSIETHTDDLKLNSSFIREQ